MHLEFFNRIYMEIKIPVLRIQVLLFHIWQAESHVQQANGSDPGEIEPGYLVLLQMSSQLETARQYSSAAPTY